MKKTNLLPGGLSVATLAVLATVGLAQIKSYTLDEMVTDADNAVYGEIIAKRVFRVDDPVDGPELFYTTMSVQGRSLYDGTPMTVDVTFHGGFISPEEGVYNSEAPADEDVALGNKVVVFYAWADNMGGQVAGNGLLAAHGGLFRTVDGLSSTAVLGRGAGYAVEKNVKLTDLDTSLTKLAAKKIRKNR